MTSNQTLDTIFSRSSYRGDYKPVPVPRGDLTAIMKAGMAAPSGVQLLGVRNVREAIGAL